MVEILPFKGYRYNKNKIEDFEKVVAPPYDVIKPKLQNILYEKSNYGIVRIIKGKELKGDNETNNKYSRAADLLNKLIGKNYLVQEEKESIYVYSQVFEIDGFKNERTGFIALLKLEVFCTDIPKNQKDCVGVHQHEETLPKDIQDRLNLLRTTKANFGQIFSIYSDPNRVIDGILESSKINKPLMIVNDDNGVIHKLWKLDNSDSINKIIHEMNKKKIVIADGHHRYKTAFQYSKENDNAKYRMMTFVNTQNKGLVILPTHRLIRNIENFNTNNLLENLKENFEIETLNFNSENELEKQKSMFKLMKEKFENGMNSFGMYCNTNKYYVLTLKDKNLLENVENHSDAWKKLDVTILHKLILEKHLGIDKEKLAKGSVQSESYVEYIKGIGNAVQDSIRKINIENYQVMFFMNPTKIEEVDEVAGNHETMPQKSTFFYPKVYTGFVVYKLRGV